MKLIVGLGNPGAQYEQTRHNVGFMALDFFAQKYNLSFRLESKFKGMLASITLNENKALLLKPMTFMNLSGESVKEVMEYYKISVEDILIISDDLDSHNGRVRLRAEGSAGGHNGHKNIIAHLKTEEYKRVKIGIGRSEVIPVIDWVLQKFNKDDFAEIQIALEKTCQVIEDFITGISFNKIASLYSSK